MVQRARPVLFLQSSSVARRRRPDGRVSRTSPVGLTLPSCCDNICLLSRGRLVGPTVDVGYFPPIFFPATPMSVDALLAPIRDHIAGLGFELVDLRRVGTLERPILQVRVDRPDSRPGHGVTADDCAGLSRSLERFLESSAMVGPRYVL